MPKTSTTNPLLERCREIRDQETLLKEGGGKAGQERQKKLGRLNVRQRLSLLLDNPENFLELNLWSAYGMYQEFGEMPAAGVVTGIGEVSGHACMLIANDATVKAGAFVPQTAKKVLRAQRIAFECALPLIYLVDSAGIFLPMQDEVFPDEDDFGRVFRNNAVLSAAGIPQFAAIMGNCVAGGAYLPVLCDKILMTEGSGLYLAGPSLAKAAIGEIVDAEELGGVQMHAEISGTVDFKEKDDTSCLKRIRKLVSMLPQEDKKAKEPALTACVPEMLYDIIDLEGKKEYDTRKVLDCIVDKDSSEEYKKDYGKTLLCTYARIGGQPVGIVANQKTRVESKETGVQIGGVIYADSADKAARFVMDCNQTQTPLVFLQDVQGFMVGKNAEQSGIIRCGAKLVNAISNSIVPKITIIIGGAYGAGNYALCGKAFDPNFIFAWPNARYAVMGGAQASATLFSVLKRSYEKKGISKSDEELQQLKRQVHENYTQQTDIRYGAARGWLDAIIQPHETRKILIHTLQYATRQQPEKRFHSGVLQV